MVCSVLFMKLFLDIMASDTVVYTATLARLHLLTYLICIYLSYLLRISAVARIDIFSAAVISVFQ